MMIQSIFTGDHLSEITPENILDEAILHIDDLPLLLGFSVIKGKFVVKTRLPKNALSQLQGSVF